MGNDQSAPSPGDSAKRDESKRQVPSSASTASSTVLLWGCKTLQEHRFRKALLIQILRPLKGEKGLIASGMEYRSVSLQQDGKLVAETISPGVANSMSTEPRSEVSSDKDDSCCDCSSDIGGFEEKKEEIQCHRCSRPYPMHQPNIVNPVEDSPTEGDTERRSTNCKRMTRLFHKESNTMITKSNRKKFIADGAMYDIICRLIMEYAQEVMMREADLEWVTIPNGESSQAQTKETNSTKSTQSLHSSMEPIQALMSTRLLQDESRLSTEPLLVIVTGKGHVRAGVFSRQHLLISGLELGSAVPFVIEAHKRKMNLIVLDPNAHGDGVGMVTFEKSMKHLFRGWESNDGDTEGQREDSLPTPSSQHSKTNLDNIEKTMFVLSHSQSGAQLVRYLLKKEKFYLPRIRAVAFTDSTHNIQWTKRNQQTRLRNLLESDDCIYFKRSNECVEHALNPLPTIGQDVETDHFWKHRFGNIRTCCAGTSDHSLTNWFAREHIWDHFDRVIEPKTEQISS